MIFYLAAILLFGIGIAHSYLGEKYILIHLFRNNNLPKLLGGTEFTKNTLRFAWHLTTIAWFGFAVILLYMAAGKVPLQPLGNIIGVVFIFHFLIALIGSRGKHFSWPVFLAIGIAAFYGSNI